MIQISILRPNLCCCVCLLWRWTETLSFIPAAFMRATWNLKVHPPPQKKAPHCLTEIRGIKAGVKKKKKKPTHVVIACLWCAVNKPDVYFQWVLSWQPCWRKVRRASRRLILADFPNPERSEAWQWQSALSPLVLPVWGKPWNTSLSRNHLLDLCKELQAWHSNHGNLWRV